MSLSDVLSPHHMLCVCVCGNIFSQELEQIPLFMTQAPEQVDAESAPALAALQDLKYSEGKIGRAHV